MKFPITKLWRIEREILDLKNKLLDEENNSFDYFINGKSSFGISDLDVAMKISTADTKHKIDILEIERKFLLDRQNNLFWRIIWNIIVPIIVSISTIYITTKFM